MTSPEAIADQLARTLLLVDFDDDELCRQYDPLMSPLVAQQLEFGEANVAARVGFSLALGEYLGYGPAAVCARLAELGGLSRGVLTDVTGWAVVEEAEEPSAITTLAPTDGADPRAVRDWLLAERRILTTFVGVQRAPLRLTAPVLRISPHLDTTAEGLLSAATAATSA